VVLLLAVTRYNLSVVNYFTLQKLAHSVVSSISKAALVLEKRNDTITKSMYVVVTAVLISTNKKKYNENLFDLFLWQQEFIPFFFVTQYILE